MIRPSNISRVMACPASDRLCAAAPVQPSGPAAEEGTEAHAYAAGVLNGTSTLDGIPDDEMRRGVEKYVNVVNSYRAHAGRSHIEYPLRLEMAGANITGTADAWTVDDTYGLTVFDFKYGYRPVDADGNWQLLTYAVMIWMTELNGWTPKSVNLIIVQPRGIHPDGPVRRWTFDGAYLRNYYNQLCNGIGRALQPDSPAVPGACCYRCGAIATCRANALAVGAAMDVIIDGASYDMSGHRLAYELEQVGKAAELIKNRLAALEETATGVIKNGGVLPGWELSPTVSALKWVLPDPVGAAAELGVDISKPVEPITPTQAVDRKLLTKDQIAFMARRQPTGHKLKKVSLKLAAKLIKGV